MNNSKSNPQSSGDGSAARVEYRVQGLSCANCARELQDELQKMEHGHDAALMYNSGRLLISPKADLSRVESILKGDGASLVKNGREQEKGHAHGGHNHSHDDGHEHSHDHAKDKIMDMITDIVTVKVKGLLNGCSVYPPSFLQPHLYSDLYFPKMLLLLCI